jgi:glycosyltransferase involved in cell wall biosynthesis
MSMMLLEVASLGVPLICSDIPDNKAVLNKYALYFRSNDADDLARKMQWAIANPAAMRDYAQDARIWVRDNFSWDKIVANYESLYEKYGRK